LGKIGGYGNIYRDLLDDLKSVDLAQAAKVLATVFLMLKPYKIKI